MSAIGLPIAFGFGIGSDGAAFRGEWPRFAANGGWNEDPCSAEWKNLSVGFSTPLTMSSQPTGGGYWLRYARLSQDWYFHQFGICRYDSESTVYRWVQRWPSNSSSAAETAATLTSSMVDGRHRALTSTASPGSRP